MVESSINLTNGLAWHKISKPGDKSKSKCSLLQHLTSLELLKGGETIEIFWGRKPGSAKVGSDLRAD